VLRFFTFVCFAEFTEEVIKRHFKASVENCLERYQIHLLLQLILGGLCCLGDLLGAEERVSSKTLQNNPGRVSSEQWKNFW